MRWFEVFLDFWEGEVRFFLGDLEFRGCKVWGCYSYFMNMRREFI